MFYRFVDRLFLGAERRNLQISRALGQIPHLSGRKGGNHALSEWGYTIGLFHAVVRLTLGNLNKLDVLDAGCGTGRLALATKLLLGEQGSYTGIDVNKGDIDFCRRYHKDPRFSFVHLEHGNRYYAPKQHDVFTPYPFADNSFDAATALSVWTHLNEADGTFYLKEIARCLRPGGKAIVTFFLLDEDYRQFLASKPKSESRYTYRKPDRYKFDQSVDGSNAWFYPNWAKVPEAAIGVTPEGMKRLEQESGLKIIETHHGYWTEKPGLFFQDVVVFEKPR